MRRSERIDIFVEEMWKWYEANKRDLPWRRDLAIKNDDGRAYRVLISEVMLQQTQVERVKVTYREFLERFPTVQSLSQASNKEVVLAWRGMGYNSRALRLRDAARTIVDSFFGFRFEALEVHEDKRKTKDKKRKTSHRFPSDMHTLMSLPGLGHYTAAAIRNFAFNIPTPCLDTNIRRILHRTFVGPEHADGTWRKGDRYLLKLAEEVLKVALKKSEIGNQKPETNQKSEIRNANQSATVSDFQFQISNFRRTAAEWHSALMDFGALVQTKSNPKWEECPLTARGIVKACYRIPNTKYVIRDTKSEPGRLVGSTFIPNRIFRGRIVDELRDEPHGLSLNEIGKRVCIDWSPRRHRRWLEGILERLNEDQLIMQRRKRFVLAE